MGESLAEVSPEGANGGVQHGCGGSRGTPKLTWATPGRQKPCRAIPFQLLATLPSAFAHLTETQCKQQPTMQTTAYTMEDAVLRALLSVINLTILGGGNSS